jgi:hypothetical protein
MKRGYLDTVPGARAVPGSQHRRLRSGRGINRAIPSRSWPLRAGDGSRSVRLDCIRTLGGVMSCAQVKFRHPSIA